MNEYKLDTTKTWLQTRAELENEFRLWGVDDYTLTPPNKREVTLRAVIHGKEVRFDMSKQLQPKDNLRIIFYTVHAMRLNELRGMSDIFESAYLQLAAPILEKDPYDVLGLPRGVALPVCEAMYKELLKQYHPDRPGGSLEKTKELNDAIAKLRGENK